VISCRGLLAPPPPPAILNKKKQTYMFAEKFNKEMSVYAYKREADMSVVYESYERSRKNPDRVEALNSYLCHDYFTDDRGF